MEVAAVDSAAFFHVRVVVGVVVGLAITRVLNGLARLIRPGERDTVFGVHIAWSIFVLLLVMHLWWFEFAFSGVARWSFELYAFLIVFAALHFLAAALLFPDTREPCQTHEAYFFECRTAFFGVLIVLLFFDTADTVLKGIEHLQVLGVGYVLRQGVLFAIAVAAILSTNRRAHIAFVVIAFATEIWWIANRYEILAR